MTTTFVKCCVCHSIILNDKHDLSGHCAFHYEIETTEKQAFNFDSNVFPISFEEIAND